MYCRCMRVNRFNLQVINIFLLLFSVLISLIFVELLLQVFTKDPYRILTDDKPISISRLSGGVNISFEKDNLFLFKDSSNPHLLYEYNPNMLAVFNRTGEGVYANYAGGYILSFQTNSFGLRDYEYPVKKQNKTFRIVVLGDSVTFGNGLNLNDTVSKRLEKLLNANQKLKSAVKANQFEVINFGISGYNVVQETELLKTKAINFSPDLVIFNYVLNDVDYPHPLERVAGEGKNKYVIENAGSCAITFLKIPVTCSFKASIKKIRLFALTNQVITKLFRKENQDLISDLVRNHDLNSATFKQLKESYKQVRELSSARNFKVIITIFPYLIDFKNYKIKSAHDNVRNEAEKNKFFVVDLLDAYKNYFFEDLKLLPDDVAHPNSKGHEIAANETYKNILDIYSVHN